MPKKSINSIEQLREIAKQLQTTKLKDYEEYNLLNDDGLGEARSRSFRQIDSDRKAAEAINEMAETKRLINKSAGRNK